MRKQIFTLACTFIAMYGFAQNVGIGTTTPAYKLDVLGIINGSSNAYFAGYVGIGNTSPNYKITVQDGSVALYNSTDLKYWVMNYNSSGDYFNINEDGGSRLVIANGGNVGIGTTAPTAKLDVNGSVNVTGNVTLSNDLVLKGNKGAMYNAQGSTNIRYYTRTAAFTVVSLAAHTLSPEGTVGFSGFTTPPQVFVGNITSNGGTAGPLYQLQLVVYDVTVSSCKVRILNASNAVITQNITWNIMCVGY
ncbi:MAG: hypothetical protein WAU24_08435 [Chitinophagaceae bacterium]